MADVTLKRFDELENDHNQFLYAGRSIGVTSWGMNIIKMPPNWQDYPEHDHVDDGQEEVYIVLEGEGILYADTQSWPIKPGMLIRVGPQQKRKITPGDNGMTLLALGGTPGQAYTAPAWAGKS